MQIVNWKLTVFNNQAINELLELFLKQEKVITYLIRNI